MIAAETLALLVDGEKWPRPGYAVEITDPEPDHVFTVQIDGEPFRFTAAGRPPHVTIRPVGHRREMVLPVMGGLGGQRQIGTATFGRDGAWRLALYTGEDVELLKPRVELSINYASRWPRTLEQAVADVADGLASALEQAFFATAPRDTIERMLVAYGIEK